MRISGGILSTFIILILCLFCVVVDSDEYKINKPCGINEEYDDCGTYWWCELNCDQPDGVPCPDGCVEGCFCIENYIRDRANGTCICKDDCPRKC